MQPVDETTLSTLQGLKAKQMLGYTVHRLRCSCLCTENEARATSWWGLGIQGAKHTALLIPLCHNILLSKVGVELQLQPSQHAVFVQSEARTTGQTGGSLTLLCRANGCAVP